MKKECEFFILSNRSHDLRKPLKLVNRNTFTPFSKKITFIKRFNNTGFMRP